MTKMIVDVGILTEEDIFHNDMMLIFEPVLHFRFAVLPNVFFSEVDNTAQNANL